jgi:glycosyltransferase involved in cell wall biosynthesis
LSLQKGIVSLIEEFRHQVELGADAVLGIAGAFDDIGSPTTGLNLLPGYFYQRVQEALSLLPPEIQKRVLILGNLSKEELRGLYSAADSFVSLSLYHDEDFGMAPAEALSCGLPSLLSSWGGYSSFAVKGAPVTLIDTSISERGLNLDYSKLRAKWNAILTAPLDPAARAKASRAFRKVFSVPAVAATLHELHQLTPPHFTGFSWKLSIPKTSKMLRQGLYQDIYTNYVSSHSEETL